MRTEVEVRPFHFAFISHTSCKESIKEAGVQTSECCVPLCALQEPSLWLSVHCNRPAICGMVCDLVTSCLQIVVGHSGSQGR
jgi:hypothetical protein